MAKKIKINRVGREHIYERKQLQNPRNNVYLTGKTGTYENDKAEREIKEKLVDRSASNNARRRCRSGTPGNAREVPIEPAQKKDLSK